MRLIWVMLLPIRLTLTWPLALAAWVLAEEMPLTALLLALLALPLMPHGSDEWQWLEGNGRPAARRTAHTPATGYPARWEASRMSRWNGPKDR